MDMPYGLGFLPEEDSPQHWGYEELLQGNMTSLASGDVDMRPFSQRRHHQGQTNSCVANAVTKALEIKRVMYQGGHGTAQEFSRLMVYYLARELTLPPTTSVDRGTYVSHACDAIRRFGVCLEEDWPFQAEHITQNPPWRVMRKGYLNHIDSFYKIRSKGSDRVDAVIECLQAGEPVVYGTELDTSWFTYKKDQVLKVPTKKIVGRHATVLLGWRKGLFLGENSWGHGWGDDGFYQMDPEVIASEGSRDFWVLQCGHEAGLTA